MEPVFLLMGPGQQLKRLYLALGILFLRTALFMCLHHIHTHAHTYMPLYMPIHIHMCY